ncbi:hypothetical protein MGG_15000 [Pyricularia oryzae 70-15]|uniref:Uncharacterized protein n=1 Tax=Pyricularia oryzae (strain 70-15 / ATCC MYA-4617 / FGSC 8958) TaxID=242507 RepID=G4NLM0_PYRO7|nr:uncharacterized protein MGG_15000 [Pyricularia oryzae 70-15]EHA46073.1 hypothetical protein MGG_15000 [Pyricularia oryzae 70-15]
MSSYHNFSLFSSFFSIDLTINCSLDSSSTANSIRLATQSIDMTCFVASSESTQEADNLDAELPHRFHQSLEWFQAQLGTAWLCSHSSFGLN